MAALRAPSSAFLSAFLPIARAQLLPEFTPIANRIPLLQRLRTSLLPALLIPIPSLLGEIWDGLLNAVPKQKTSHSKKRHRQLASGKGLKDVTALNKCSSCGRTKRAHVLCPYCVQSVRQWIGNGFKTKAQVEAEEDQKFEMHQEERRILGMKPLKKPEKMLEREKEREKS